MSNVQLLKDLGLSEAEIIEKVVGQIADQMLYGRVEELDYEDVESGGTTTFKKAVDAQIRARIDEAIDAVASKHTLPNIVEYFEGLCLQRSNAWGEAKGEAVTFIEYLTERADAWLLEKVDYQGKSKGTQGFGTWDAKGTRVQYLIDNHLRHNVEVAMKNATKDAHTSIEKSLNEAVKIAIGNLKITTKTDVKI